MEEIKDALQDERDQTQIERDFLRRHRNFRKHWVFPLDFPNFEVVKAYRNPPVNESIQKFGWGDPDFFKLRELAEQKMNWRSSEIARFIDETEKAYKENKSAAKGTLENYFHKKEKIIDIETQGKRVVAAARDLKLKKKKDQE